MVAAHSQFGLQEYKNFYLTCIQLVASLKEELSQPGKHGRSQTAHLRFLLGYSYFMKTRAELTFLEARKQGITLVDDFNAKEAKMFTADYFKGKALKSANKSLLNFGSWKQIAEFVAGFKDIKISSV